MPCFKTQALTDFLAAVAGGTAPPGTVVDGGGYSSSTSSFSYAGLLNTSGSSGTGPKAFINWLIFDRDYDFKNGGYVRMTDIAKETGQDVVHERLAPSSNLVITEPGYVYIYLSNENETPVEVFFDDFSVEHVKSPVVQMDDYYAFGLTFNSYQRENSVKQKFKFQGQEHIDDLGLGWDAFKWRNHQPDVGRFFGIDPLAEDYYYNSPYAFSENKVISHRELEGLEAQSINGTLEELGSSLVELWDRFTSDEVSGQEKMNTTAEILLPVDLINVTAKLVDGEEVTKDEAIAAAKDGVGIVAAIATSGESRIATIESKISTIEPKLVPSQKPVKVTTPYSRPSNATTPAQRKSVQGKPCSTCGVTGQKMYADHKNPLVKEHYQTGKIDKKQMKQVKAVQPQCQKCSGKQGAEMRKYSEEQKKKNGLK